MEITADTSLDVILRSSEVQKITMSTYEKINSVVLARVQALTNCIKFPGFSSEIEGQELLSKKANEIMSKYSNFLSELSSTFDNIDNLAINKEYDELMELKEAIERKIPDIDAEIQNFQTSIDYYNSMEDNEKSLGLVYYNNAVNGKSRYQKIKTDYNNKLQAINKRLSQLDLSKITSTKTEQVASSRTDNSSSSSSSSSSSYINEIPNFEVGADGKPTTQPADFQVDSHHRLNIPGWGCFYEAANGGVLEFHYDSGTNKFYNSYVGEDWDNYDYANDIYGLTPEEMKNSCIGGGIMPG